MNHKKEKYYELLYKLNKASMLNQPRRNHLIKKLFGSIDGEPYHIQSPLYVEYGHKIHAGKNFLSNYNAVLQDEAEIIFGDNVMLASNVILATNPRSLDDWQQKSHGIDKYLSTQPSSCVQPMPIRIGSGVWICANVTVLGGVTIGDYAVIGAGSIVTCDIPRNTFACGTPCRIVREITEKDRLAGRRDSWGDHTMTEFDRMTAGYYVNTMCKSILLQMARGYILARRLNRISLSQQSKRERIARWLFGSVGKSCCIGSLLSIEYGKNVYIGDNFSAEENLVIQDGAPIHIGNNVSIKSNVVITTVMHSLCAEQRKVQWIPQRFPRKHKGLFIYNKPIIIGNHVQIGDGVTICAGVTIGDGAIINAGSVVTRDIPSGVLAYGAPCREVCFITDTVGDEKSFEMVR